MSFNQSRSDKSETQYRKSGRSADSNQQRTSSGAYSKGGGGGGGPALTPSSSSSSSSSNRSFKKSNNAQGGHYRAIVHAVSSSDPSNASASRHVQNGAHLQTPLHIGAAKPIETPTSQRCTRAVAKAPTSQSLSLNSDNASPTTPVKSAGDAFKAFPFQFGSISPGFMNGMQIPARTSSAPPNLDEQKCDQGCHDSFTPVPSLLIPAPKQQLPRKDVGALDQANSGEPHPVSNAKKDIHITGGSPVSQTQKSSVLPIPMTSMQMPFHQPPVSVQFGGPNPQIQSQGVPPTSLQVPMPMTALPMGNAPQVQQPMFVQGLQPHPMQPQGIMHQGQGLTFAPQMSPQMAPQLGNLGVGITSQYPQQQGSKFGGQRKITVKITDPKTHEELRLDKRMDTFADSGSSGLRPHPNRPPHSQPIPAYAPSHPINYYSNSYNPNGLLFQPSSSLPLTSGQIAPNSQPSRFNYSVSRGIQNSSIVNPSAINSLPHMSGVPMHVVAEPSNTEHARDAHDVISSAASGTVQVKVKPPNSVGEKVMDSLSSNSSSAAEKGLNSKHSRPSVEANSTPAQKDSENDSSLHHSKPVMESVAPNSAALACKQSAPVTVDSMASNASAPVAPVKSDESMPVGGSSEGRRKESLSRSNSMRDHQKKPGKKGYINLHQVGGKSTSISTSLSHTQEQVAPSNSGISDSIETKTTVASSLIESVPTISSTVDITEVQVGNSRDSSVGVPSEVASSQVADTVNAAHQAKVDDQEHPKNGALGSEGQGEKELLEVPKQEDKNSEISSVTSESADLIHGTVNESVLADTPFGNEVPTLETMQEKVNEPVTHHMTNDTMSGNSDVSTSRNSGSVGIEKSHLGDTRALDPSSSQSNSVDNIEGFAAKSSPSDQQFAPPSTPDLSEATSRHEGEAVENSGSNLVHLANSSSRDKATELTRTKSTTGEIKKKKEILQKADAAGTTSDLYMAYKGPGKKKESAVCLEVTERTSAVSNVKQAVEDALPVDSVASDGGVQNKAELDDWEDAADISTPNMETSDNREQVGGDTTKKYSRDFLLKFSEQFTDLPESFTSDIADALMSVSVSHFAERDSFPSPGRVVDRTNSGSRMDRWGGGMVDEDKRSKLPGPFGMGRDLHLDIGFGGNAGFRPGQGVNYSVMRNPRTQGTIQYAGGILSAPMQSIGPQGGMQRNSPDADSWQRATDFQQKGLIPSPHTPLQMMHKAERKYEVGKVQDEEEAKQRQLKAILNKLTPQNFEKLFEQVKAVNIDNAGTLTGVISQIFDKALMEPTFCEMYANFCYHLASELPGFTEDNEKINFKRLLLNKCQEEFERGKREQEEANKVDEEGETKQSEEEREEKRIKARRRMLGNIRLIGELYKKKMLTGRIMHECIKKLLGQYQNPDEEDIEALCKLMSTIGEIIDHPKTKEHMDAYFDRMAKLSKNMKLSSRVRFMLKDAIDLRKNKWQQRRKVEGPKKIEEVHRDAAQERHHHSSRLARNPSINPSQRRAPMDFAPRGSSVLFSPNSQMGGFHGMPSQVRGYGDQAVRFDDRQSYEARTLSVPLSRPLRDDTITLGSQGGLARGMSIRGPPAMASTPLTDLNGFSTPAERQAHSPREDFISRDPRNQECFDRPLATSPPGQAQLPTLIGTPSEKVWPEERLRDMSMTAIKEFYSARDEREIALCIKELNSSGFHPSMMISLWVTDSFERKDMERDLLAKLLISLARYQDAMLTSLQLVKGFESVLTTLEDAVNDAPKAAEFLGRMFAKVVVENVVSLREIEQLLYTGGEEPGRLLEIGLAGDVLGSTLETIKAEKGERVLNEIRVSSNLHLEDFRPDPNRSRILEKFI